MAIQEFEEVRTGLVKFLAMAVGDQLSTLGFTEMPSILKDRTKGPRPEYPYLVVDKISVDKEHDDGWLLNAVTNSKGITTYTNEQRVTCKVHCYDNNNRAHHILNLFRSYTVDEGVRYILNTLSGSTYQHVTGSIDASIFVDTDYVDGSYVIVELLVRNEFTIPENINPFKGTIETINLVGVYNEDIEGQPQTVEMPKEGHVVRITLHTRGKGFERGLVYDTTPAVGTESEAGVGLTVEPTMVSTGGTILTMKVRYGGEGYEMPELVLNANFTDHTIDEESDITEEDLVAISNEITNGSFVYVVGADEDALLEVVITRDIPLE